MKYRSSDVIFLGGPFCPDLPYVLITIVTTHIAQNITETC